jgi:hypothetical protein
MVSAWFAVGIGTSTYRSWTGAHAPFDADGVLHWFPFSSEERQGECGVDLATNRKRRSSTLTNPDFGLAYPLVTPQRLSLCGSW